MGSISKQQNAAIAVRIGVAADGLGDRRSLEFELLGRHRTHGAIGGEGRLNIALNILHRGIAIKKRRHFASRPVDESAGGALVSAWQDEQSEVRGLGGSEEMDGGRLELCRHEGLHHYLEFSR